MVLILLCFFAVSTFGIDQLRDAVLAMGEIECLTEIFTIGLTIGVGNVDQVWAEITKGKVGGGSWPWSSMRR